MKTTSLLAVLSLFTVLASLVGLALNAAALALFAAAAVSLVLLIATTDYRSVAQAEATVAVIAAPRRRAALPLAA